MKTARERAAAHRQIEMFMTWIRHRGSRLPYRLEFKKGGDDWIEYRVRGLAPQLSLVLHCHPAQSGEIGLYVEDENGVGDRKPFESALQMMECSVARNKRGYYCRLDQPRRYFRSLWKLRYDHWDWLLRWMEEDAKPGTQLVLWSKVGAWGVDLLRDEQQVIEHQQDPAIKKWHTKYVPLHCPTPKPA